MFARATAVVASAFLSLGSGVSPLPAADSIADVASGIAFVGDEAYQVGVLSDGEAADWDAALMLAFENRDDFGYPWMDPKSHSLMLRPLTHEGRQKADALEPELKSASSISWEAPPMSVAQLEDLADDVTRLSERGVAGAEFIWMTEPDQLNNRVIVTVSKATPALLGSLVQRYGTTSIAVRISPAPRFGPHDRDDDAPAFWGGAKISTPLYSCTTGFAWTASIDKSMLFAGHCAPFGGNVGYTSRPNVGSVASGTEENWSTTLGTVNLPGQTVYRGDLALIRYSSLSANGYVYDGAIHTTTNSPVTAIPSAYSKAGDVVCANGAFGGEHCGTVHKIGVDVHYTEGVGGEPNVWLRNAVEVDPDDTCPISGDSGGPIYRRSGTNDIAVGIYSGGGPWLLTCRFFYTDIHEATVGLPGSVQFQ